MLFKELLHLIYHRQSPRKIMFIFYAEQIKMIKRPKIPLFPEIFALSHESNIT